MLEIKGVYTSAIIYSQTLEDYAAAQIQAICDSETAQNSKIRVMPDVHPGKVGPIGLTMTISCKLMPNLIGIDIGCGISYLCIGEIKVEFQRLDSIIRSKLPTGSRVRREPHYRVVEFDYNHLACAKHVDQDKADLSLGTLGGGNHFLELDRDEQGMVYAFVHSGSRRLGKEVTEFYLKEGQKRLKKEGVRMPDGTPIPYELTYLEGQLLQDYLHDLQVVQEYASLNRSIMLTELTKHMKWKVRDEGESVHNYVDESGILRKGAAAAHSGQEVIIPVNMRDGIILGIGRGNQDWNCSAPHGAGRILRRDEVKKFHTVSEYKDVMKGIYSPTLGKETLDEAPFAYRGIQEILDAVGETVEVRKVLKPFYNYKGGEEKNG